MQLKRDLNMSMTIDTSNNTLREGLKMRVSPSKQDFVPLMPIVQGLMNKRARHRYGNSSLAGGIGLGHSNLYSSIQLQPGHMNRFKSKIINDTDSYHGQYSTSIDHPLQDTQDQSNNNILTTNNSNERLRLRKNLVTEKKPL